ncbi:MAG TPA: OmpA family protein [Chiayiivirga sp.]|nr:OmpA family protein [Chiayiivirga sp.]
MKKTLLGCALFGAMGLANVALAQDFDDRWYLTATGGLHISDSDRNMDDNLRYGIGVGKYFSPNFSLDLDLNTVRMEQKGGGLHWNDYGFMLTGRSHFRQAERNWGPYLAYGAGMLRHEEQYPNALGGKPHKRSGNDFAAQVGAGLQADYSRTSMRAEVLARYDGDNGSFAAPADKGFIDYLAQLTVLVKLGDLPPPPAPVVETPPPPPPPPSCADLDGDGDGVNNCDDRCPDSQAGQTVGPDGCPVAVTIDLRGVNFDYDKSTLRADAVETLKEAVSVLVQYPELRVEVAGHTDLCGADAYNQSLSERRAKAVYDYLTSNGVAASRLVGPTGYGESRPLEPTAQTFPACKSETNRRTELNVQN